MDRKEARREKLLKEPKCLRFLFLSRPQAVRAMEQDIQGRRQTLNTRFEAAL